VTGIVHSLIGAGLGALFKNRAAAFAGGVISHAIADALPHRDLDPKIEVPLLVASLTAIAARYGLRSTQFAGALGAVLPDSEHALLLAGIIDETDEAFPTHIDKGKYHGPDSGEHLSQVCIAIGAVIAAELGRR
jgi:hypothetical protein